ncbi:MULTISPECIES: PAS domain-containing sensor histidine kinase [unclassified Pseudomonas]|uniref:PAS domain-containing sensor histidine kinase n=1 Tax=unclassified Pseudomonas TaxID=196821 RepID=UPI002356F268|nr:PAS domain-containing sensor histidine kinase [Pseudomonas sp. SWRI51]
MNALLKETVNLACICTDVASQIREDTSDFGLLLTSQNGQIASANAALCRLLGYKHEALVRMRLQQLLTIEAKALHQLYWQPLMGTLGAVANVKFDFVHCKGFTLPLISNAITCAHSNGIVHELTMFNSDEQRYERDLLRARLLAERCLAKNLKTQRALLSPSHVCVIQPTESAQSLPAEQILGIVSHELRTPLLAIRMATDLLTRRSHAAESPKLLTAISHSVSRAQRLVADLLDFTLIQAGRGISIQPRVADLPHTVEGCLDELRLTFPGRQLTYQHTGERSALIDSDRLYQLIGNLVANAVAYGDPSKSVYVTSCIKETTATLTVHNSGAPISLELLKHVFEPLVRGNQRLGGATSIGLGLFIVSQIAKAHAGCVSVDSTKQNGTTFTVRLSQQSAGTDSTSTPTFPSP